MSLQESTHQLPFLLDEVEVVSVERLSPSFLRIELGGPALAEFGVDGPLYDQRVKLVFPNEAGEPPPFPAGADDWYSAWLELPDAERGHMRTYTVREIRGARDETRLVVDVVLHSGATGPGATWAARAAVGDRLVVIGPRRGAAYGGIEFEPGAASELLLAADETAVPAVCSILEDLDPAARGAAFLEVPVSADAAALAGQRAPAGVDVVWLPRDGTPPGSLLDRQVRRHLGIARDDVEVTEDEVDPDLWETPTYSSSGEDVGLAVATVGHDLDGVYAWIAGESGIVTGLRRVLVNELGMDRRQVAFMGYWRRGVAMRS